MNYPQVSALTNSRHNNNGTLDWINSQSHQVDYDKPVTGFKRNPKRVPGPSLTTRILDQQQTNEQLLRPKKKPSRLTNGEWQITTNKIKEIAEKETIDHASESPQSPTEMQLVKELKDIIGLHNLGTALGSSLSFKEVVLRLYQQSSRLMDTANFAIAIYNEQTDTLDYNLVFDRGRAVKPFHLNGASTQGLTGRMLTSQAPVLVAELKGSRLVSEISKIRPNKSIGSWLGVPISSSTLPGERLQGAIMTWSDEPDAFGERDLWLLSMIATQAAIAMHNARLFEASQQRAMEMAVVNDIAHALSSTLNPEEVLTQIMDHVEGMLNVDAGYLLLTDPATGNLIFQMACGDAAKTKTVKPFCIPKGRGIAGQVAQTGKPVLMTAQGRQIDFRARNLLCVPLILNEQIIGVLEVINKRTGPFTHLDLNWLNSIAAFAAIALKNARLHQSILAERDRVLQTEAQTRKALARDLHDGPTQLVSSLVMRLDFCQEALQKDPSLLLKELPRAKADSERAVRQMRTALFELRPLTLKTEGLEVALTTFLERRQADISDRQSTKLKLEIEAGQSNSHISRQDGPVEGALFAIIQETVNNALKHAQAKTITVRLKETATTLSATISDDGRGFDVSRMLNHYGRRGSLGMLNIQERAELVGGEMSIDSMTEQGTTVKITVPKAKAKRLQKRSQTGRLSMPPA